MQQLRGLCSLLLGIIGIYGCYRGWIHGIAQKSMLFTGIVFSMSLILISLPALCGIKSISAIIDGNRWVRAAYVAGSLCMALACGGLAWQQGDWTMSTIGWYLGSVFFGLGSIVIHFLNYRSSLNYWKNNIIGANKKT